jgi:hypothetical protein
MKIVISPEERNEALRRWKGGIAKVWLYHISLRKLAVRIQRVSDPEVLYIVANGCEHISGPFVWPDANISILDESNATTGANLCIVADAGAEFELRCSTAALVRGPANEVDQSFGSFLGDAPEEGQETKADG